MTQEQMSNRMQTIRSKQLQRARATHYVSLNLVICATTVQKIAFKRLAKAEWSWR